jgi:Predicted CoA-binding protein
MADWKTNLIEDGAGIERLLRETKTIAVLGIKPESHADQAAHYVPAHMAAAGFDIIPVPVYYPDVTEILGKPVVRKLADIGRPVDMANVFRRPTDIPPHLDDILAASRRASGSSWDPERRGGQTTGRGGDQGGAGSLSDGRAGAAHAVSARNRVR